MLLKQPLSFLKSVQPSVWQSIKRTRRPPWMSACDRALDKMSFVWLGKTPTGQIGLKETLFFLREPPKPHLFSQPLNPRHSPLALCSVHHTGHPEMPLSASPSCPTQARIHCFHDVREGKQARSQNTKLGAPLGSPLPHPCWRLRAFTLVLLEFPPRPLIWATLRAGATPRVLGSIGTSTLLNNWIY